jgi:hypothetical protein
MIENPDTTLNAIQKAIDNGREITFRPSNLGKGIVISLREYSSGSKMERMTYEIGLHFNEITNDRDLNYHIRSITEAFERGHV